MANSKTHVAAGVVSGIIVELINVALRHLNGEKVSAKDLVLHTSAGIIGSIVGAKLPDIIEPAYGPDHRDSFHSVGAGTLVFGCTRQLNKLDSVNPLVKSFIRGTSTGYISHLVLDSKTPKGIKLL